jgi:hypothetical protein
MPGALTPVLTGKGKVSLLTPAQVRQREKQAKGGAS